MRESLFQPFVQQDSGDARRSRGAGLGLSISRGLLERMHGSIAMNSPPEGGTLVTIELPAL